MEQHRLSKWMQAHERKGVTHVLSDFGFCRLAEINAEEKWRPFVAENLSEEKKCNGNKIEKRQLTHISSKNQSSDTDCDYSPTL